MKNLLIIALMIFAGAFTLRGQDEEIKKIFEEYGLSENFVIEGIGEVKGLHAYDYKSTETTSEGTTVREAHFDPRKPVGEQWELLKVNGNPPSNKEIKRFNKEHNQPADDMGESKITDLRVKSEDDKYVIIGFKIDGTGLPKKYKFLNDCEGEIYLNKETKKLEKVTFRNFRETKVSIFKVPKLEMVQFYTYHDDTNSYLVSREELVIDAMALGQTVEVQTINEYFNFQLVNK